MKSPIIILVLIVLFGQISNCQTKARITGVDFELQDRYIVISYYLTGSLHKEQMAIGLEFITEKNETIIPKSISGDIGDKVFHDGKKVIIWDINADSVTLSGNLKAIVSVVSSQILYSGPSKAFLSVLVPGLGGYYVDKNKTRSVLTTISSVGLIIYGLNQKSLADKYYKEYNAGNLPSDIENFYNKANDAHNKYFIATRVGIGLWIADVIWVTYKGFQNKKAAKSAYSAFNIDGINLNYINNGFQLGYSVSF